MYRYFKYKCILFLIECNIADFISISITKSVEFHVKIILHEGDVTKCYFFVSPNSALYVVGSIFHTSMREVCIVLCINTCKVNMASQNLSR